MSIKTRELRIRSLGLCLNCLRAGHRANQCEHGPCKNCGETPPRLHNSLLCSQTPGPPGMRPLVPDQGALALRSPVNTTRAARNAPQADEQPECAWPAPDPSIALPWGLETAKFTLHNPEAVAPPELNSVAPSAPAVAQGAVPSTTMDAQRAVPSTSTDAPRAVQSSPAEAQSAVPSTSISAPRAVQSSSAEAQSAVPSTSMNPPRAVQSTTHNAQSTVRRQAHEHRQAMPNASIAQRDTVPNIDRSKPPVFGPPPPGLHDWYARGLHLSQSAPYLVPPGAHKWINPAMKKQGMSTATTRTAAQSYAEMVKEVVGVPAGSSQTSASGAENIHRWPNK